ncbi:hypothetical protein KGA65_08175 [Ideonella sp. B7]|uniref:hypothetical protein n=1 Tax=Ideonella benzenivorans TaxID=2831643 RepID=UPI001CEC07B8|nr:hypothetical protein [Ideonella benzenivorans]MCA6216512.1 hypothetical protein [Ideonella benzenivorans]
MNRLVLHLDLGSPEAWPCFLRLPEALAGLPCWVEVCPVLPAQEAVAPVGPIGQLWRHALACGEPGALLNRWLAEQLLRAVWDDAAPQGRPLPEALAWLTARLTPVRDPESAEVAEDWARLVAQSQRLGIGTTPTVHWPAEDSLWEGQAALAPLAQALRQRGG